MGRGILSKEMRRQILDRGRGECEACGVSIPVVLRVHHVVPVELGGHDGDDNLVAVCPNCHALIHWFAAKKRFAKARAELERLELPRQVAAKIEKYAAEIIRAKDEAKKTGLISARTSDGAVVDLPTLPEALAVCARKNALGQGDAALLAEAVTTVAARLPVEIVPRCAFRLTHQDRSVGISLGNYLLVRAPARPDVRKQKDADGIFVIATPGSKLAGRFPEAFRFSGFSAINIWCCYEDIRSWGRGDWKSFEDGCRLAAAAPRSRSWLSNIRPPHQ